METRLAQPALFITELAMARLWMEWGIEPKAMTGHSLGEFVAAVLAGVMSREDGLRLVAARGLLMQQMERGAMLSVRAGEERISALLDRARGKVLAAAGTDRVERRRTPTAIKLDSGEQQTRHDCDRSFTENAR